MLRNKTTWIGLVMAIVVAVPATTQAIPAWARKYKMDCASCHFGGSNKLTYTGVKFQRRGYVMPSDEPQKDIDEINLANYMSMAGKVRFEAEADADPATKFDVEALSLYSGGPMYDKFSYFFEIYLHERGKDTSSTGGQIDTATRSKLAEAYAQYTSNPMGDEYYFARAGSYTPRLLYSASTGGRLSVNRPLIWNDNVGGGNLYTPRDRFYGATIGYSGGKGLFAEAGLTNGGGGNARPNQPEFNTAKDLFGSIGYTVDDNGSSIGLYGYKGFYPITAPTAYTDEFSRVAVMAELMRDNFVLSGAYSWGTNKNANGTSRKPKGFYLEAGANLSPRDTLFARYDSFDYDLAAKKTGVTVGWSKRMSNIGRFVTEFSSYKAVGGATQRKLTFELNWMF